jgi:DNA-binding winged helix-turn-helix (wHTH) protein
MLAGLQEQWRDAVIEDDREASKSFGSWALARRIQPVVHQDIGPTEFRFGRWCLVPAARLLLRDGEPVDLGSRAFDLLHLLLSKRGLVVEKGSIVSFVWPNTIVEESNLRFQMAALRRALGDDRSLIKTIPGRGYILAAEYRPA